MEGRGRITPPALNIDYPTNRALSYADNIVDRPPACFLVACFLGEMLCFGCKDKGLEVGFALRFERCFQSWGWDVGDGGER